LISFCSLNSTEEYEIYVFVIDVRPTRSTHLESSMRRVCPNSSGLMQ
jgi:hypothetical protein